MYHKDIGSCEMYRHKTNARVQIPEGEKFMNERNVRPFSKRDEIGYVFGDMAGSFVNLFVDAYFLTFCTYVLGISPAWMTRSWVLFRTVGCLENQEINSNRGLKFL